MATYEEEMLKKQQQEAEKQNQGQAQQQNQAGSAQTASLAQMTQANAPEITSAQQYLDAIVKGEKPQYQTAYAPQIQQLYDKVMNRGEFKYDVNSDPVYQQLRGEWQNAGRMAMEDTIAQATGLSGGYGNSFAQAAGQQQYNQHMQQMGAVIPQLRSQAYQEYANEGEMLQNQLLTAQQMDALEYEKFRNEVGDLWNQQQFNYNKEQDLKNYEMAMQQMTMAQRESAFQQAMAMMQAGLNPGAEMLAQAGISEEDAKAYLQKKNGGSGGGSGNSLNKQKEAYAFAMQMIKNGMTPSPELIAQAGIKTDEAGAYINAMQNYYGMGGTQGTGTGGTQGTGTGKPPASATDADAVTSAAPPSGFNSAMGAFMNNAAMAQKAVQEILNWDKNKQK